jgi:thiol-disulfide isomerase/thioredoxin
MTKPDLAVALGTFIFFLLTLTINSTAFATTTEAPAFELPADSGTISLEQYRDQVVFIDFWASWCIPCKYSFPWLNEMQQRYAEDGLKIIAINIDEDQADAREFLERVPASFEIAYDPEGDVADLYRLKVMPSSYLIDRNGNLIHSYKGFKTSDGTRIEEKIQKLLKKDEN